MSNVSATYRPDIDGLRGIAVFCVVLFHAGVPGFSGGFVGVDIFFVISGYLICTIIQREIEEHRFSFAKFYVRRAKRILPALFVMLLASFVLAALVMTSAEMQDFSKSAVATIAAFSNIYFWKSASYFSTSAEVKPLMMTWSLSVEEQFYFFFPSLLLLIHRQKWRADITLAAVCLVSLAASAWTTSHKPSTAFFLLPTRAWELVLGAMLAQNNLISAMRYTAPAWLNNVLGAVGLFALAYSITRFDNATPFPGIAALVPVVGTAILISTQGCVINRHVLENKILVFIGLLSYSWYLWHWPFLSFARMVADHPITLTKSLTLVALSFLVSIVSWRFVERPFRAIRHDHKKTLCRYGAATAAMLAIGIGLVAGRGWQARLPKDFVAIEQKDAVHPNPCLANYGQSAPTLESACIASTAGLSIALIGDSHAAALAPGLRALAARQGFGYTELTKSSCPALYGVSRFMPNHPEHDRECAAFNRAALAHLHDDPTVTVVFIAGYWSAPFAEEAIGHRYVSADNPSVSTTPAQSRQYLRQGMEATVNYLSAAGKKIVLFKDVPIFNFDPVRAVATEEIPARKWFATMFGIQPAGDGATASNSQLTNKGELAESYIDAIAKEYPQVTVIDPALTLCDNGRCTYNGNGKLYYIDSQHLSEAGATVVAGKVAMRQLISDTVISMKDGYSPAH